MSALCEPNALGRVGVVARVDLVFDALRLDFAPCIAGEDGMGFEEPFDLRLALEPTRGKAFQGLLNEAGMGFIAGQDFSLTL